MPRARFAASTRWQPSGERCQQRLSVLPIGSLKALREPTRNLGYALARGLASPLLWPQAAPAHRGPQLERPSLLATGHHERLGQADDGIGYDEPLQPGGNVRGCTQGELRARLRPT